EGMELSGTEIDGGLDGRVDQLGSQDQRARPRDQGELGGGKVEEAAEGEGGAAERGLDAEVALPSVGAGDAEGGEAQALRETGRSARGVGGALLHWLESRGCVRGPHSPFILSSACGEQNTKGGGGAFHGGRRGRPRDGGGCRRPFDTMRGLERRQHR